MNPIVVLAKSEQNIHIGNPLATLPLTRLFQIVLQPDPFKCHERIELAEDMIDSASQSQLRAEMATNTAQFINSAIDPAAGYVDFAGSTTGSRA